jgi:TRAP-type mannitol/chloroaromatic compound transport system permease small subunit
LINFLIKLVKIIDAIIKGLGAILKWLIVPLTLLLVYEVLTRRIFANPHIWTVEVATQIFSLYFLPFISVGLLNGAHVRVDIFYENFSKKMKCIFDIITYLVFLLLPTMLVIKPSINYAITSWIRQEVGPSIAEVPLYPIKTIIPITFILIFIAGLSELLKKVIYLKKGVEL